MSDTSTSPYSSTSVPAPTTPSATPAAPTAPTAPSFSGSDPNQDPSYLAFLRGAGFSQSQIQAQTAQQNAGLQAQINAQKPYWAQQIQTGVRSALDNAAGRGVAEGSNRIQDQNSATSAVNKAQADYETGIANQIAGNNTSEAGQLAQLQQQQADQALTAQQNVYNSNATNYQSQLENYYAQLLGGAQ